MSDDGQPGLGDARPKKPGSVKASDNKGHRERLRARFAENGADSLQDYELLELLLFQTIPRKDTKPLAKKLLVRFGSFAEVLAAPPAQLAEIDGLGEVSVSGLKLALAAAQRIVHGKITGKPLLGSWDDLIDYCRTRMAFEEREQFRILFLDKKNKLIRDEVQQVGTVDHTPVYPREIIKRSLELSATALILVHNHPSGDPSPSNADLQMTKAIIDIATPLGITIHDHVIIGRNGHLSMKSRNLI